MCIRDREKIVANEKKEVGDDAMDVDQIPSSFDRSVEPTDGPQPGINLPEIWKHDYDNGISLYGANHDELPMVSFGISIEGGMLLDTPNKIGVANLVSDMMMEGTANKTPIELEEAIDDLGSSIYTYTSKQAIYIEVNTLKRNFAPTLEIVEEILFEPRWDSAEFDRIKRKTAENI